MKIKDYNTISTKKGDKGTSINYSNETYFKDDLLFNTLGTNDELSSTLGLVYHYAHYEKIKTIQQTLQAMNALIATNQSIHKERYEGLRKITDEDIQFIENEEADFLNANPIEPHFYLPGSETTKIGAHFDLARAVCRRAERELVRFIREKDREDLAYARQYLNRLSDLLFILARNFDNKTN